MKTESANLSAAEIRERIWLSIAEKRLRPGLRLKEEELAEVFDVSRARVRQVLAMLASDGLVTILPNRGAFVSEPTAQEAQDVFHVRKLVEDRVIERLIGRLTPNDFARLEAHVAATGTAAAIAVSAALSAAAASTGTGTDATIIASETAAGRDMARTLSAGMPQPCRTFMHHGSPKSGRVERERLQAGRRR